MDTLMPKRKAKPKLLNKTRPFLAVAVFCEQILEETPAKDKLAGVVSAIRIFDQLNALIPATAPNGGRGGGTIVNCLIILRTATAPSKHVLQLVWTLPDGKKQGLPDIDVNFVGSGQGGFNLKATVVASLIEGTHLLDVSLDGKNITTMPLKIVLQKEKPPQPAKPGK